MAPPHCSVSAFLLLLLAAPALLPGTHSAAHASDVPAAAGVASPVLAWPPVGASQPVPLDWLPVNISARPPTKGPINHFIQRAGTQFVVASVANDPGADPSSCDAWNFVGVNAFWLMLRAADPKARGDVLHVLDSAAAMGLTVLRTWAFADGAATWRALQRSPGVYDESTFQGLDFVIHQAGLRGLRILLAFGNAWQHYGGIDQYNTWSFEAGHGKCNGQLACRDDFWRDPYAAGLYKNHIRAVLLRKNTFSGRVYRDDPTLFGWDLMNEPRSSADLFVTQRKAASGPVYNLTFNNGSAAQDWVADMAAWTKSLDPVHLLTVGSEGFFGPSSPLYQYANPGPWASLLGVDFVANHKAKGIDFASTHIYVDQWFCVEKGATPQGQLGFFNDWVKVHIQAAEEELQMPLVLEEFGARLDTGQRAMLYQAAFDAFAASAQRRGAAGGVMFWDLYHPGYAPLDVYGGRYGNFVPPATKDAAAVLAMVVAHASRIADLNSKFRGPGVCVWTPPKPLGSGCGNIKARLQLGAMPWACLPGEPENVNSCAPPGSAGRLYLDPPVVWRGGADGTAPLPVNAIEALVMGGWTNTGSSRVNLRGSWFVVPYSRGVMTKYEGEWLLLENPNGAITRYCWFATTYTPQGGFTTPYAGDLCRSGLLSATFTTHVWPQGTKADRGLNLSFAGDLWLDPGASISAGDAGRRVMLSFKAGTTYNSSLRLDVSSLELKGASSCPTDPGPPYVPPAVPAACPHPWRACPDPMAWGAPLRGNSTPPPALAVVAVTTSTSQPVRPGGPSAASAALGLLVPGAQYHITARVRVLGMTSGKGHLRNGSAIVLPSQTAGGGATDTVATSAAPNPGERFTARIAQGVPVQLVLRWRSVDQAAGTLRYSVLASGEAPVAGNWTKLTGIYEFEADPSPVGANSSLPDIELAAEAAVAGATVELADLIIREPWALPDGETAEYVPCQLDPDIAPDAVIAIPPTGEAPYTVDITLCSLGYDQSVRVYDDTGALVAATDAGSSRGDALKGLTISPWKRYAIVIDGVPGEPYGSTRGGCGVKVTRPDGRPSLQGLHAASVPADAARFVRAVNGSFYLGCDPFVYVGTNSFDLMDTARYPNLRYLVDRRMDEMKSKGLTVGRTWGFSLGTGESLLQRQQALQLKPGVYDETVFQGLDYALVQARKRGIKLILAVEDYWLSAGRYIEWSKTAGAKTDFFTDWSVRGMYRAHLRYFTSRVNTLTGVPYMDDPTIFAWNLINEPRCTGCGWALQDWVDEMAAYMKALDPHHMVTIGEEGFYSSTCERVYLNPGAGRRRTGIASSPWALQEGQDMLENHRSKDIDLASTHAWPDNWLSFADYSPVDSNQAYDYANGTEVWREKLDYLKRWVAAHIEDGARLGKPIIVEEFGKVIPSSFVYSSGLLQPGEWVQSDLSVRNRFFQAVYDLAEASALKGGTVGGSNFWVLYRNDGQGSVDPYRVTISDNSTFQVIANHRWNLRKVRPSRPRVCPVGAAGYTPSTAPLSVDDDQGFLDVVAVNCTVRFAPTMVAKPPGYAPTPTGAPTQDALAAAAKRQDGRLAAYVSRMTAPQQQQQAVPPPRVPPPAAVTLPPPVPLPDATTSSSEDGDDGVTLPVVGGTESPNAAVTVQSGSPSTAAVPAGGSRSARTLELTSLLQTVNAAMAEAAARDARRAAIMPAPTPAGGVGGSGQVPWWAQAAQASGNAQG